MTRAEIVKIGAVGSAARATSIGSSFSCGSVGGSCEIRDSGNAEISVSNVGGTLHLERVARMSSCNVGGSLTAFINVPANESANFVVGGGASLSLPRNANLRARILACGSISGEAGSQKRNNMATLTYGDGAASLNLTAGGSVKLSWYTETPFYTIQEEPPSTDTAQKRQAILTMVEQGRITPEEGNVLLEALG